jgi:hypothetical protein
MNDKKSCGKVLGFRELKLNPEYEKLFPRMSDRDYKGLKLSIEIDGQHYPIIVNQDDYILDGYHRNRACKELGKECKYEVMRFSSKLKELDFVLDSNNKRRHMNEFQKVKAGYNFENLYRKYARERHISTIPEKGQKGFQPVSVSYDTNIENGRTADKIAERMGISPSTYNRGKKVIEVAPQSVIDKLEAGKTTVFAEHRSIINQEKRQALMNEAQKIQITNGCDLRLGEFMEAAKTIPDNSIPLILTDPPYGIEYLYLYEKLGVLANRVLMEGGSLITYPNFLRLESLKVIEKSGLMYRQQFCVHLNGHHGTNRAFGNTIDIGWKSLDWFVKGNNGKTNRPAFIYDFIESEAPKKVMHEWEQSTVEAEHMIKGFTVEGQVVLDPMMGYATNGVAALKLKRQFIGIEIDPYHYSNAQRRLSMLELEVYQK